MNVSVKVRNRLSPDRAGLTCWLATLLMLAGAVKPATAEEPRPDPPAQSGWQFNLVSFAWLPSITGSIAVRGASFADNASFSELIRKSESVLAFEGHVEAWKNRFGVFLEPIWMKLGFGSPHDILFTKLTTEITYVEFGGLYRAFEGVAGPANHRWSIDALAGGRFTDLEATLSLSSQIGGAALSQSKSWVDPFIGARARIEMTPTWDFSLRGDIGGFGAGSLFSWNLVALVGHRFPLFGASAEVFGGFKALYQDYRTGSGNRAFRWNNTLWGPVLGLSATF